MKNPQTSHAPSLTLEVLMEYLEGTLSERDVLKVDQILAQEPEWILVLEHLEMGVEQDPEIRSKTVAFRQVVSEIALNPAVDSGSASRQKVSREDRLPIWRQPIWQMAAVILLILLPAGWIITQNNGSYLEQMSELYLEPFGVTDIRSAPSAANILDQGLVAYQQGQYVPAARDLARIANSVDLTEDDRLTATMYLGLALLFSDQYAAASEALNQVVQAGITPYQLYAKWYLAWSHWKGGRLHLARAEFEELAQIPSAHQKQAQSILDAWE